MPLRGVVSVVPEPGRGDAMSGCVAQRVQR